MNDLKFAWRQLLKYPVFTLVAVVTLALGIGANTALFSIVNGVLLKPLPYPEADRLVTLWERNPKKGIEQDRVSGPNYLEWRARNRSFVDLAVSPGWAGSEEFNIVLRDGTTKVRASYTSASLFTILGTKPLLGRALLPEEDRKEGDRSAVIAYGLWQRQFGRDPNVIGQTVTLDTYGRRDYTIVGVMPPGFGLPSRCEIWLPIGWMGVRLDERRSAHWHYVIGRLKPGITIAQARSEMNMIQGQLHREYPVDLIGSEVDIVPLLDQALGRNLRKGLFVLWGVVGGVLLIACANVANLLLARAVSRRGEMTLRVALGASRWRVIRQLLTESVVLALCGGALGAFVGWWGLQLLVSAIPADIPRLQDVSLDRSALVFTMFASVLTGVLFGLAPAWQFSRPHLNQALQEVSRGTSAGIHSSRMRNALVVAEVAVSLPFLVGAGLMLQSFLRLAQTERGFKPESLMTAQLDFSVSGFTTWVQPTATRPQVRLQEVVGGLAGHPGVEAVATASNLPRRSSAPPSQSIVIAGRTPLFSDEVLTADYTGVSPHYFRTLGVPLLAGRDFTEADHLQAPQVLIVNETLAKRYFPNEDPIGKRISMGGRKNPRQSSETNAVDRWPLIVGVVGDTKKLTVPPITHPEIYVPHWQWPMLSPVILVRTAGDVGGVGAAIRSEVKALIPNLPSPVVQSMDELLQESIAQPRFQSWLLTVFAIAALALAVFGIYGVLAFAVVQRRREIGIRMALGAQQVNVIALILRHGMSLVVAGIVLGIVAALAVGRVIRSLLYEVTPTDPLTFLGVSLLFAVAALMACWFPARRAAQVEPMAALRQE
jgi:predicted permease